MHPLHPLSLVSLPIAQRSFAWWKTHPFLESYRSGLKSGSSTYWVWEPAEVIFFPLNLSFLICYRGQRTEGHHGYSVLSTCLSARPGAKHAIIHFVLTIPCETVLPDRTCCEDENPPSVLSSMGATGLTQPPSTKNVAGATEGQNFKFSLLLVN